MSNWAVLGLHFFNNWKKDLVIKRLPWLLNKSSLNIVNILETLKDIPNTPISLMFLKQRVHEFH